MDRTTKQCKYVKKGLECPYDELGCKFLHTNLSESRQNSFNDKLEIDIDKETHNDMKEEFTVDIKEDTANDMQEEAIVEIKEDI